MNRQPLFATVAAIFLVSCQDDSEQAELASVDPMEDQIEKPFLMPVEDVFLIQGEDVTVTGRIEQGTIAVDDEIAIVGILENQSATVTGIEMFREVRESGKAGENVGLALSGVGMEELQRGMVLSEPGAIEAHTKFEADLKMLTAEEGGRNTPIFDGYRPQYYFWTTDVTGVVALPEGTESIKPGGSSSITVELITPIAFEKGSSFAVREGGRTVATGVVTAIAEK